VVSQLIQVVSYTFYIVHGLVINDPPVTLLGFTSLAQSILLVGQYIYYYNYGPYGKLAQVGNAVLPGEGEASDAELEKQVRAGDENAVLKRTSVANS